MRRLCSSWRPWDNAGFAKFWKQEAFRALERSHDESHAGRTVAAMSLAGAAAALVAFNGLGRTSSCEKISKQQGKKASVKINVYRKKVAVYGGAFNPPTNAHLTLASELVRSDQVDEVWLCPCGVRPDKPDMKVTPIERLVMCEIAVNTCLSSTCPVSVTDIEVVQPGRSPTYNTLSMLRDKYPDFDFVFVVGSDWLRPGMDLRKWENGDKLVEEFNFLVMKRPGFEVPDLNVFGPRFEWLILKHGYQFLESNISSTEVRKRALSNWSQEATSLPDLDGIVAPGVQAYILRHKLYT